MSDVLTMQDLVNAGRVALSISDNDRILIGHADNSPEDVCLFGLLRNSVVSAPVFNVITWQGQGAGQKVIDVPDNLSYLISHHFYPYNTLRGGVSFWASNGFFVQLHFSEDLGNFAVKGAAAYVTGLPGEKTLTLPSFFDRSGYEYALTMFEGVQT